MSVAVTNYLFNGGSISGDWAPETTLEGALINASGEVANIQVDGEVGAGTIYVEGKINLQSDEWIPISLLNTNYEVLDSITEPGGYMASVDGVQLVRIKCEGVTDVRVFARITKGV